MADRIEVSKVSEFLALGSPADNITVSKVVMYLVLAPGSDGSTAARQGQVHTQIVRSL